MGTFIVVDDDPTLRDLYATWLEDSGHEVLTAGSVSEAQQLLQNQEVDVLCSDLKMGAATGIDLLTWVKERTPDLPVILITGAPDLDSALQALRLGAYDYLLKPVTEENLLHTAKRAWQYRYLWREKQRLEEENRRYQQHLEELVSQRTAKLEQRTQQLLVLHRVAKSVNVLQNEDSLFKQTVELMHGALGYASVAIFTVNQHEEALNLGAVAGLYKRLEGSNPQLVNQGLPGLVLEQGNAIVAEDLEQWPENQLYIDLGVRTEAVFPIIVNDEPAALLVVADTHANAFDETDKVVLQTFAEHLSVAVSNVRLYERLQDALEARTLILQNVSHEFRTPLAIIQGYADMLGEEIADRINEEELGALKIIVQQTEQLAALVNQLLMFQQVARSTESSHQPFDIATWLETVVLSWMPVLQKREISLHLDLAAGLGHTVGNERHWTQVLNNLLDNACKFSHDGGAITISARRQDREVLVSVSDQGIGAPPEKLSHLFDRFFQIDSSATRRVRGMGLGLALAKEIVEEHGGRIWAESQGEGKGMTVSFTMPLSDEEAHPG